jgi:voltage-gated potassium channel
MSVESVESRESSAARQRSNAYEIFILVLTVFSLLIMVALLLPLSPADIKLLTVYDNLICVVFLIDFGLNLARSHPKRDYFIGRRGWLDLIGSIPTFEVLRFGSLLRLARISRLARITRLLRGKRKKQLIQDVVQHRGQYAAFITVLLAMLVLSISSVLVLQFESKSPNANITTGGQALWWSVVTITTVGYGDFYPVTMAGRITGVFVMFSGVGIIGALASILASILVPPADTEEDTDAGPGKGRTVQEELERVRLELVALRQLIAVDRGEPPGT